MSHTVLKHSEWQIIDATNSDYFVPLGQDRLLIFAIGQENESDTTITGVTWGGMDMTSGVSIVTTAVGDKGRAEIWYLTNDEISNAGDQNGGFPFVVTWSMGEPSVYLTAAGSYTFVRQVNPIDNTVTIEDSVAPIANPLETTIPTEAGSMDVAIGLCGNADDYFWDPFWNERIDTNSAAPPLTMTVSDRLVSTLTPADVSIDFQGTVDTYQALAVMELHPSSDEPPEIQLDTGAGENTTVPGSGGLAIEFTIDVAPNANKFLVISPGVEYEIDQTGYISLVQVNGQDAEFVASVSVGCPEPGVPNPACVGVNNTADLWYVVDPPDGTNTIRCEVTMVSGAEPKDFVVAAACLFNVGPPDILSVGVDSDREPQPTTITVQHPTDVLTANAIIIDSIVQGNPDPALTANDNQIKLFDQQSAVTPTSRSTLALKYAESTPLGKTSWTQLPNPGNTGDRAAMVSMAIDSFSDSTAPTFICTDTDIEDVTLEFCEETNLLRMNVHTQENNVDLFLEFDTCTLQVLNIITSGTSSKNVRFTYDGTPTTLTPNDTEDVSSQNIYLVPTGPYYLPTLVLEGDYSVTFI